jgi:hypothetical protein
VALVLLRDRDDEAEIRVDHQVLRLAVATLDPLGELDLLLGRQQLVAADLVEEELQRVRRRDRQVAVHVSRVDDLPAAVVAELDSPLLDVLVQPLHLFLVQLRLLDRARDLRELEASLALSQFDQRFDLLVRHHRRVYHLGADEKRAKPYCRRSWRMCDKRSRRSLVARLAKGSRAGASFRRGRCTSSSD